MASAMGKFMKEEAAEPEHKSSIGKMTSAPKPSSFLKSMKSKSPITSKRFNKQKSMKMPMGKA